MFGSARSTHDPSGIASRAVPLLACLLAVSFAWPGAAQSQQYRDWIVCGGNEFNTCASVQVSVAGDASTSTQRGVTMRVMNLSGMRDTYDATVFTKIGFDNVGGDVEVVDGTLTMDGPVRTGDDPDAWSPGDSNNAGGIELDLAASANDGSSEVDNSIANSCDPEDLPGGDNDLWQNDCFRSLADLDRTDPIVIEFDVEGTWDLAQSEMLVMGQNGPDGDSTQCITGENCTVVPEPLTVALLGSGLAGLGGVSLMRRRREEQEGPEDAEEVE